jgi:hypothetical protein
MADDRSANSRRHSRVKMQSLLIGISRLIVGSPLPRW